MALKIGKKRKEQIEEMLKWVIVEIDDYEKQMCGVNWGCNMNAPNCVQGRKDYAGWLAQRDLLQHLLAQYRYDNNNG